MIAAILKENFSEWSPGLSQQRYYHYQWWQYSLPWAKRHLSYWAYASDDKPLASCKLYDLVMRHRSCNYRIAGIGAVFTPERLRGSGLGLKLLESMIDLCRQRGYDALMLNSDIDTAYYNKVGFTTLGHRNFALELSEEYVKKWTKQLDQRFSSGRDEFSKIKDVTLQDVPTMVRHHTRWLARRAYGFCRSEDYWHFKLSREQHLHRHSNLAWPKQEIIALNFEQHNGGYALFEQGARSIRILEIIGDEETQQSLWAQMLALALRRKIYHLRGWEGSAPTELKGVVTAERQWSRPMILPLNPALHNWLDTKPCPLIELDHY